MEKFNFAARVRPERARDGTYPGYTDLGGYPLVYLVGSDAATLCAKCASREDDSEVHSVGINWEDETLICAGCSTGIECAYPSGEE